jgi:hypothetical protein
MSEELKACPYLGCSERDALRAELAQANDDLEFALVALRILLARAERVNADGTWSDAIEMAYDALGEK